MSPFKSQIDNSWLPILAISTRQSRKHLAFALFTRISPVLPPVFFLKSFSSLLMFYRAGSTIAASVLPEASSPCERSGRLCGASEADQPLAQPAPDLAQGAERSGTDRSLRRFEPMIRGGNMISLPIQAYLWIVLLGAR